MNLNVGCGEFYAEGWVNVDLPSCPHQKDVEGSAFDLSLPLDTVDRVYLGHVLEHLEQYEVVEALEEVRRVLRPGGRLCVVGPAIELADTPELVDAITHGGHRWEGDEHRWVATALETLRLVDGVFPGALATSIENVPDDWPVVSRAPWQCAVIW